jgi:hypothetical protein
VPGKNLHYTNIAEDVIFIVDAWSSNIDKKEKGEKEE